jgi:hypothetical protein
MTASPVSTPLIPLLFPTEPVPNWKVCIQGISEIAIQLLAPFAMTYFLYLIVPASISAVVLPIAAISTAYTISYLQYNFFGSSGYTEFYLS